MLNKFILITLLSFSTAHAVDQVKTYGFGETSSELIADGYKSVIKSNGNEIYEKRGNGTWYKIVSMKNENVTRLYSDSTGKYLQYTKLDDKGKVLGQAQCKFRRAVMTTSCDVQTAPICKELINKVESGGFDIDLKKIKECAEISGKVNYSRAGIDEFFVEAKKQLELTNMGALPNVVKSTPSSLQTLLKDYNACKAVESELSEQTEYSAAAKVTAEKGAH
ncbi:hypothetical protein DOM22_19600 [Bdellovibrio sp. ZAP7]|uniref:hypothetical protein n=1 Tax=Bdellovibrio sp. ZAP7 TaxID=2231053 RepID=UPI001157E23A|nr:hypothetical protein [Bdellovibrio sp. ZAP7]QDK47213.1 hypothetical protein DOM22_19600 [Bdellovibrio sp. ZAP7]